MYLIFFKFFIIIIFTASDPIAIPTRVIVIVIIITKNIENPPINLLIIVSPFLMSS